MALVAALIGVLGSFPAGIAIAASGPDLKVSLAGNFPTGPNSGGNFAVMWTNVGTANITGVTHVTVDFPPGLTTGGGYMTGSSYTVTQTISPDGRHLEVVFVGTIVPGSYASMKVFVGSGPDWQPGTITATVAHASDVNTANNQAAVTETGAPLPAPAAAPVPVVNGISPSGGPAEGGTTLTVSGSDLTHGLVMFGTAPGVNNSCSAISCTATSPAGAGTVDVTVLTPGGVSAPTSSASFAFEGTPPPVPAPSVTYLSATSGPESGGTGVTVLGSNLAGGTVSFGATPDPNASCGASQCNATSPPGTGTVDVTVTTAGGTSTANPAARFTYTSPSSPPAPTVTGISPTSGPAAGGTVVTISGSNLTDGTVGFGTNPATNVACSASSCTATSPPGSDTVFVTVHTSAGTSGNTAAGLFTYKSTATLSISTTGSGAVSGASPGSYPLGAAITLTANPGSGYVFSSWTVDGAAAGSANPYTLTMDRDHAVVAKFTPVPSSGPTAAVSPSSLAFGSQLVGTASSPQTVTLTNSGGAPLSITKIALGGANPGQFTRSSACPSMLSAGASCQINVAFKPSSRGSKSAVLSISDNAPNSPQTVALTGQGVAPVVGLSTSWLSFPDQLVATTSAAKTVAVRNKGDAPLSIGSITISGDFAQTSTCPVGPSTLAAGASCTISVTMTPKTTGDIVGELRISDNAAGSPQIVGLDGWGS